MLRARRALLPLVLAPLLAAGAAAAPENEDEDAAPLNVLLVVADDLGLQLGCYGETAIETPHLDAFASTATRFETAWVSQASCSPSRASLFTGLFPHANGQYGLRNRNTPFGLREELHDATLPALLAQAGYRTGILGKLHVGPREAFPFDVADHGDSRDVRAIAERAAAFFAEELRPFFLFVGYVDPHVWRESQGRAYFDRHKGLPEEVVEPGHVEPLPFQGVDSPAQRARVAGYLNAVRRLDVGVGLLLDALEEAGRADDTLVVLLSDHGPPFARAKTTCYEAGLRVPFVVRWPGVSRPGTSRALVSAVDVLPTILDAADVEAPSGLHGQSLRPVLAEQDAPWRDVLCAEFNYHGRVPFFPRRAIRDRRFKLIHNLRAGEASPATRIDRDTAWEESQGPAYEGTDVAAAFARLADPPELELYDLDADPWELRDLASDPDHAEVLARLRASLHAWRVATDDPLLHADELPE